MVMASPSVSMDRELVDAVMRGDSVAAAPLYQYLRPSIEGAVRRIVQGRRVDFEDVVQTSFERVVRAIGEGRFEYRSKLSTWAGAIAGHVALDWVKRNAHERRLFSDLESVTSEPMATTLLSERRLEARSEVRRLGRVLGRMKPKLARILLLHHGLGNSVAHISKIGDHSVSATHARLRRARQEFARRALVAAQTK
jgi:RNA polymerase sigma factor (sigma-70 family)